MLGLGRAATSLTPVLLVALASRGRVGRRAALVLTVAPPLARWWRERPGMDPFRWVAASVADDVAYGTGVWIGCLRMRTIAPLLPAVGRRRAAS